MHTEILTEQPNLDRTQKRGMDYLIKRKVHQSCVLD
jgi:hypothetical protein